ncbi:MAG: Sensory transduction histidine kinase [Deltaproteobacteria bacterium]|nr:Sensory transduction histidine kinase [Deltaproteobacteria bacterium]
MPFSELPLVRMDGDRVMQVVENLLGNVLKFTPPGGKVIVSPSPRKDVGNFVRISIANTGPGIPKEHLAQILKDSKGLKWAGS